MSASEFQVEHEGEDPWAPGGTAQPSQTAASVLDDLYAFLGRFIAYPDVAARIAHTLWLAHTHAMDAWESTPRIAFVSPEPGSGKTRALEISELVVPRPVEAVNVTPSYLFRKVADRAGRPTILFDEIDTVFGPKAKDNEEIRGLLNAGHRPGAVAGRCVVRGNTVKTEEIPAYCAVALAGLGSLPDTILSRSIIIRMRKRAPDELVEPYRRRDHSPAGHALRDRLAKWMAGLLETLKAARPAMPDGIRDRDADVWEPLLAIADVTDGTWPQRSRNAAVTLVALSKASSPSLGIRLLSDIRDVFRKDETITTEMLLARLHAVDEGPWTDLRGKSLDPRGLAQRLKPYSISSTTVRAGEKPAKGYKRVDFSDAWRRYLEVKKAA